MPKCSISPPTDSSCCRNNITAVGNRRSTEHDHQLSAGSEQFVDRLAKRRLIMRHAAFRDDLRAGRRYTLSHDLEGLLDHL